MIDSETRAWIEQTVKDKQTDSAFHDDMHSFHVKHGDREVVVITTGEMRYLVGDKDIRDSLGLIEAGIDTDEKLEELDDSCRDMNNWFEVYPLINGENTGIEGLICDSTDELEGAVIEMLTDDEWWEGIAA